MGTTRRKPGGKKSYPGRPSEEKQNAETDGVVVASLSIGATIYQAAELVGVKYQSIFYRMTKNPDFKEQVLRARAEGLTFRRMMLEESLHTAVQKIENDPRYTVLAIFLAKAELKLSDIPEEARSTYHLGDILAEIVRRKKTLTAGTVQNPEIRDYLPITVKN